MVTSSPYNTLQRRGHSVTRPNFSARRYVVLYLKGAYVDLKKLYRSYKSMGAEPRGFIAEKVYGRLRRWEDA